MAAWLLVQTHLSIYVIKGGVFVYIQVLYVLVVSYNILIHAYLLSSCSISFNLWTN